jgi:ligand-binding sensor domain-containing protein/signal transduction histidine kinase
MRKGWRLLAMAVTMSVTANGWGLFSSTPSFEYTRSLWRTADGLPEATVQSLAETPNGMLWIGTTGGLASFGGAQMRMANAAVLQSLGVHSIFCLTVDRDGSLWAGTEGGGLLHLRGNDVKVFSTADGLTDGFVRSVFQDSKGALWVGTDNGLFRMRGGRLQRVDDGVVAPPMAVHSITEDHDGNIWAGGSQLIAMDREGKAKVYALPGVYSKNRVKRILQTANGTVWVGTVGGLQRLSGNRFELIPSIRATVRTLLQTSDGTLWIGTIGDGLWTYKQGELRRLNSPGLLPSDTILTMLEDDNRQVWIGTQAGLVRLSRTEVGVVALPQVGDPDFETVSGDTQGNVWVAAQGLSVIKNGQAHPVTFPGLGQLSIRNIYRARDGALWLGTDGSGAYRLDGDSVRHLSAPAELTNNFIRGFLQTRDGAMWIATDEGVSRLAGNDIRKFTEASGLVYFSTRCLLEDHHGGVWIGTDRGMSFWTNGAFQKNAVTVALAREKVWSILQDRQNVLWFATRDDGLFRYRDGRVEQYTSAQGLPSNSLYQLLQDRRGIFWFTGPDTIASIDETEMDTGSPSRDHPLSVTVYSMPFGADGAQLYGGRQPAGYLAPDDTLWFPTSRGAAFIKSGRAVQHGPGPRAVVNRLSEDGRSVPLDQTLHVPAGVTRLSLGFGAVFLRSRLGVRFRYRLEPFEHNWNTTRAEDTATYTNLAAGDYRFRVQTFDEAQPDEVSEADLGFTKAPFFYETWWFYTIALVVAAVMILAVYRSRVRQMRNRFQAVLAERGRLAREIHDTVIQGCTGISALLEAIASRNGDEPSGELLDYARHQARTTIDEARQAVWDMRHDEKDVDLLEAMKRLAEQTSREHGNVVTLKAGDEPLRLGTSTAHEILMTVREAVYNAVQHSGSGRIEMSVERLGGELVVRVADFGRGFDCSPAHAQPGHFGLVGMGERMKRLGGRMEIRSTQATGTTVLLRLRYAKPTGASVPVLTPSGEDTVNGIRL